MYLRTEWMRSNAALKLVLLARREQVCEIEERAKRWIEHICRRRVCIALRPRTPTRERIRYSGMGKTTRFGPTRRTSLFESDGVDQVAASVGEEKSSAFAISWHVGLRLTRQK